jgi:phosphopantetheinyl transferase (holo-ACP synthase)
MIGNDIVDIVQSRKESNWRRTGFIDKLFTIQEQLLIAEHSDPEIMVWRLWTMKEAAYKIYNRETTIRAFIPKQLICNVHGRLDGIVRCNDRFYFTKTAIDDNSIYSVAVTNTSYFGRIKELHNTDIVKDDHGLPYIVDEISSKLFPVSVTHHGKYLRIAQLQID